MPLFTDYIQPLTLWLYDHPNLALVITFLISFTESLAIIGSVIPGSVTMTAIGILAGSGVMRVDLTLLAASLGAITGDSASYMLGYIYSDRLSSIWPFKNYPTWINYGKDYFNRHGGKSVLIGRFIGPLRSIIPVIAGMMHMSHLRFYMANIISAVGWSLLYVMPGVLIGTASDELSPETATQLFVVVLLALAGLWLVSAGIKWLLIRAHRLLHNNLHQFWCKLLHNPYLSKLTKVLTPAHEVNHYPSAALLLLFILATLLFFILAIFIFYCASMNSVNQSLHLFFQSLRTQSFDIFFIIVSQIISPFTILAIFFSIALATIYYKDRRSLFYWLALGLFTAFTLVVLHFIVASPRPVGLWKIKSSPSFPISGLTLFTAFCTTILLYINAYSQTRFKSAIKIAIIVCLFLVGLAPLYLGDNWFTDILGSYLCGLSLAIGFWLFYRRSKPRRRYHYTAFITVLILILLTTATSSYLNYSSLMRNHRPYFAQFVYTDKLWWNQSNPLLPIYRTNRIGHRISLFNLQYVGSLENLENALARHGWQKQKDSLLTTIITRVNGQTTLPALSQLYLNKKPALMMIYEPEDGGTVQILRMWRSNYHLKHQKLPIWIGSVHPRVAKLRAKTALRKSISYVSSALPASIFLQRDKPFPEMVSRQTLPVPVEPNLLLIRERSGDKPDWP